MVEGMQVQNASHSSKFQQVLRIALGKTLNSNNSLESVISWTRTHMFHRSLIKSTLPGIAAILQRLVSASSAATSQQCVWQVEENLQAGGDKCPEQRRCLQGQRQSTAHAAEVCPGSIENICRQQAGPALSSAGQCFLMYEVSCAASVSWERQTECGTPNTVLQQAKRAEDL